MRSEPSSGKHSLRADLQAPWKIYLLWWAGKFCLLKASKLSPEICSQARPAHKELALRIGLQFSGQGSRDWR